MTRAAEFPFAGSAAEVDPKSFEEVWNRGSDALAQLCCEAAMKQLCYEAMNSYEAAILNHAHT